jgi:hypothetical protein
MNPAIFQPAWLRANQLVGEKEAQGASAPPEQEVEVIHREVTILNLTKMKLVVDTKRFAVTALDEPFERAKDFAMGCFQILSHTPVTAVGLNS